MSPTTVLKHKILTAALALSGLTAAAAEVHTGSTDAMAQWYGRAGGLVGSDVVSEQKAWQQGGQSVQVSFSPAVAEWTNMPRDQAQVGPVMDSFGAATQPGASSAGASPEPYGRAGHDSADEMQMSR